MKVQKYVEISGISVTVYYEKICIALLCVAVNTELKIPHCKKELAVFPSPAGMSLIKLFLGGKNLVFPAQREFGQ